MKMNKFDKLYNLIMEDTKATNNTDETKKTIVQEMQDLDWEYKTDEEKLKDEVFYQIVGDLREAIAEKTLEEVKLIQSQIKQLFEHN